MYNLDAQLMHNELSKTQALKKEYRQRSIGYKCLVSQLKPFCNNINNMQMIGG